MPKIFSKAAMKFGLCGGVALEQLGLGWNVHVGQNVVLQPRQARELS
ncbi:MAG TPA: hypothetical protein VF283_09895 [Bryobacteraceae bacterium]